MNDNQIAIFMLRDVTDIINAIENNDDSYIFSSIRRLKDHISDFETVVYENKAEGLYRK